MITIPEFYAYGITWNNVVCDISKVEREDDMILLFLDFYINEETFRQNKKENIFYGMLMDYFASGINIGEEINSNTYDYVLEQMIEENNNPLAPDAKYSRRWDQIREFYDNWN